MDVERIRQLLIDREAIDAEIFAAVNGKTKERKPVKCSLCDTEGHTARNCPKKGGE